MRWNGRQIRNACQTALAIAEFDAQKDASGDDDAKDAQVTLSDGHINTVFSAYLEFMRYLKNIYGKDADRVAKDMGIRAREAAIARLVDEDDDSSDSDDDDKPKKQEEKQEAQPPSTPPQALTSPTIPFLDNKIPAIAEINPSLATTNGSPTPSAAAGHYQLSSGQPQLQHQSQAPNPYMIPNGYPTNGPPPTFYPPYMNMMYNPQAFMQAQAQGQYPNMPSQQPQVQAQTQTHTQTQASLTPGSPPQMPNAAAAAAAAAAAQMPNMMQQMPHMMPQMAAQMAAQQGWPNMNWQGMQGGGPMMYPGMAMGNGNESTPPLSQPGA
jgi:hypothetical protein